MSTRKERMKENTEPGVLHPVGGEVYIVQWPPYKKEITMKPGVKTSEFWSMVVMNIILLLMAMGILPADFIDSQYLVGGAAANTGLYAFARGKAKSNSG